MRKIITALLVGATLATPLAAQPGRERRENRQEVRDSRQEVRDSRLEVRQQRQRFEDSARAGRPVQAMRDHAELRRDQRELRRNQAELRRDQLERRRDNQAVRDGSWNSPTERQRDWRQDHRDDRRDWRDDRQNRREDWRDRRADRPGEWRDERRGGGDGRDGWRNDARRWSDTGWNRNWRSDGRYNWQGWRDRNRNLYRAPRYFAPRGYSYGYRRWAPGYRIQSLFYAQNYWIADPWTYRLPPAGGPFRWVRYYEDALLIDVRTGLIEDVIHSFFW